MYDILFIEYGEEPFLYIHCSLPNNNIINVGDMDIEKQLEVAAQSNHLVLVVFYADWSPHYEWIGPVLRTYEQRVIELINVNIEGDKAVADSYNIETVPAFLLLHKGHELWRQVGELTVEELKEVLEDFK